MSELLSYVIPGIANGSVYSLIALGFVLIYKCSGVLNLAQGELVIIGGYIFYLFTAQLGLPLWAGFLATFLFAMILGVAIERLALRPLLGQPLLALIIVTLVIGGLLKGVMMLGWGAETLSLPTLFPTGGIELVGILLSYEHIAFFIVSIVIGAALLLFFRYSRTGVEMMGTADDSQVTQSLGINVKGILTLSWVIACMVSALGGILMTSITGVHYTGVAIGMRALAVVLLGGLESLGGVLIAGPLIGVIEFVTAGYIDPIVGGGFRDVVPFVVMILALLIRPYGFFGWKRIERV